MRQQDRGATAEIAQAAGVPFILKGHHDGARRGKAIEAGAAGIVVSNHGGRVLDDCPATEEVLADIVAAVDGRAKILVDGGIRSGSSDVFKALALGARRRVGCPPLCDSCVRRRCRRRGCLCGKLGAELADTMRLCGAASLADISRDMVRVVK